MQERQRLPLLEIRVFLTTYLNAAKLLAVMVVR
jgi:hypothetical protein